MKHILVLIVLLIFSASTQAKDNTIFSPVSDLFLAVSNFDHEKMRAAVDDSFLLLEHGEVWTIDDFINVVKPADYLRTNYFSVINSRVEGDVAFINYWNKANFKNTEKSADIYWLESVVVSKVGGKWLLSQMHSTRLPQGESPKGVTFIKQ
ncbi:nuclear transport factor 2 family protein [Pseudoalteromonas sp. S3785]|uniref:nuclear transport factor 2 family protein n=1 Tax=Pseudoalteromonas sp. S3785 TaxID=579545 RepID=UPI00110BB451|nr:nuclear transport factor 2 family protein [Pseudoalteromonas sp. S3785]TMO71767.1 nuclear transport factor 2 family protein [Pseudoalteromonas sp. S3785]